MDPVCTGNGRLQISRREEAGAICRQIIRYTTFRLCSARDYVSADDPIFTRVVIRKIRDARRRMCLTRRSLYALLRRGAKCPYCTSDNCNRLVPQDSLDACDIIFSKGSGFFGFSRNYIWLFRRFAHKINMNPYICTIHIQFFSLFF